MKLGSWVPRYLGSSIFKKTSPQKHGAVPGIFHVCSFKRRVGFFKDAKCVLKEWKR